MTAISYRDNSACNSAI